MVDLQTHQQEAYDNVKSYFSSGDRSIVIFPTGCGKSFVSLKLMEENRQSKILFVCPSEPIRNQMYQYIIKYLSTEETNDIISQEEKTKQRELGLEEKVKIILPQFKALLYQTISSKSARTQGLLDKLAPDFIICDEVHHIKTKKEDDIEKEKELLENVWGKAMVDLVNNNPQAKILGITATPERGDGVNVAIQFFDGKIANEISLIQALSRDDIPVKAPDYVPCVYTLLDELNDGSIQEQIMIYKTTNPEKAEKLQQKLEEMRKIADSGKGITDLFTEHLTTPMAKQLGRDKGKYIVFCDDIKDMKQKMEEAKTWFSNIDSEPEIYAVSSDYNSSPNNFRESEQVISSFEQSQSNHIKLLFSVNMLNEGLHVDDVTGVIMTRKTNSRNVYLQQLGRAISSNPDKPRPIVFDIANNYLTYNIYEELINARKKQIQAKISLNGDKKEKIDDNSMYESDEDKWVETFKINGIMKDLLELLQEKSNFKGVSILLKNCEEYRVWCEQNGREPRTMIEGVTASKIRELETPDQTEQRLGVSRSNFFNRIKGKEELTEEEEKAVKIYEEIDAIYGASIKMRNYMEYSQWCEANGRLPRTQVKGKDGKRIKSARKGEKETPEQTEQRIGTSRARFISRLEDKETLSDEEITIIKMYEELDKKYTEKSVNMQNCEEYCEWCKNNNGIPRVNIKHGGKTIKLSLKGEDETPEQTELRLGQARRSFLKRMEKKEKKEKLSEEEKKIRALYQKVDEMYIGSSIKMQNCEEYCKWCMANSRHPRGGIGIRAAKKGEEETPEQIERRLAETRNSFFRSIKNKTDLSDEEIKIKTMYEDMEKRFKKIHRTKAQKLAQVVVQDTNITDVEKASEFFDLITKEKEIEGVDYGD